MLHYKKSKCPLKKKLLPTTTSNTNQTRKIEVVGLFCKQQKKNMRMGVVEKIHYQQEEEATYKKNWSCESFCQQQKIRHENGGSLVEKIHQQQQQEATQTREEKLKLRVFSPNNNKKQQHKIRQENLESWVLFLQATKNQISELRKWVCKKWSREGAMSQNPIIIIIIIIKMKFGIWCKTLCYHHQGRKKKKNFSR
jgi:hypothetical protein